MRNLLDRALTSDRFARATLVAEWILVFCAMVWLAYKAVS